MNTLPIYLKRKMTRRPQVYQSNIVSKFVALASQKSQVKISVVVHTFVIIYRVNTLNKYIFVVVINVCLPSIFRG